MTRSERVYRTLLRAYPGTTRAASGEDMVQLFGDRLRDAATPGAKGRVWVEAFADVAATAARERLASRRAAVAEGPSLEHRRSTLPELVIVGWPLVAVAIIVVLSPGFAAPMFDSRASFIGLPAGTAVLGLTAILASFGCLAARHSARLAEPEVQVLLLGAVLAPVPVLAFVVLGVPTSVAYAVGAMVLVLVLRFRLLMLALVVPFLAWLLLGPATMLIVVGLVSE